MKKIFQVLLGLNGVMQLVIGAIILFNFEMAATSMFQIEYVDEMAILGVTLGVNVIFTGVIALLSLIWTLHGQASGYQFGLLAISAGVALYIILGDPSGLVVDVPRGLFILITGCFARRTVATNHPVPQPSA